MFSIPMGILWQVGQNDKYNNMKNEFITCEQTIDHNSSVRL